MPDYRVLKSAWIDRVYFDAGTIVRLTEGQAKYHLMAERIAPLSEPSQAGTTVSATAGTPEPVTPQAVPKPPLKRKKKIGSLGGEEV